MTEKERITELEAQVDAQERVIAEQGKVIAQQQHLIAEQAELLETSKRAFVQLEARVIELERRLRQDSHNSSKPPSSDGMKRQHRPRPKSPRKPGGQPEHPGQTLTRQATADQIVEHRPEQCWACAQPLDGVAGQVFETRQVQDVPEIRVHSTDHQVLGVRCPHCGQLTCGTFPAAVTAPVQYGPRVRAAAVYLNEGQLLPNIRTVEVLHDLWGVQVSPGSLETWVQTASTRLQPFMHQVSDAVADAEVGYFDESGVHVQGILHWLHAAATPRLTVVGWSAHRGKQAMEEQNILPRFRGIAMHDRFAPYFQYAGGHALCHAHLQRELTALAEAGEEWAAVLQTDLRTMYGQVGTARQVGQPLRDDEREACRRRYFAALNGGFAAHPPPADPVPKVRGRPRRSVAENLLRALLTHAESVLRFVDDPRVPLTNNLAEQALRMAKVQQKISGTFRSPDGATAFCRIRSYLATCRKQGLRIWEGFTSLFTGELLMPALS